MPSRSRSYTVTAPFTTLIYGIPITTFIATCISGGLYLIILLVLIIVKSCMWSREKVWFFSGCLSALIATLFMIAININYTRYRFTKLSLTASLVYSGTAAIMVWLMIHTLLFGICPATSSSEFDPDVEVPTNRSLLFSFTIDPQQAIVSPKNVTSTANPSATQPPEATTEGYIDQYPYKAPIIKTIFKLGHIGAIACWVMGVPAVAFQIVAHLYYG